MGVRGALPWNCLSLSLAGIEQMTKCAQKEAHSCLQVPRSPVLWQRHAAAQLRPVCRDWPKNRDTGGIFFVQSTPGGVKTSTERFWSYRVAARAMRGPSRDALPSVDRGERQHTTNRQVQEKELYSHLSNLDMEIVCY